MSPNDCVTTVRRFSRFYTRRLGLLHEGLLGSPFSLTEGRLIYELAQREGATAREARNGASAWTVAILAASSNPSRKGA